jgi:elongation factor P hydroxylase
LKHRYQDLITLFELTFFKDYQTRLLRGSDEPVYLPIDKENSFHQVIFAHGYYSSALHEVAHWCIAGDKRRAQIDYGYWYSADGRNAQQQSAFESVEVKPQAIEWAFSVAANKSFQLSTDNIEGVQTDPSVCANNVRIQVLRYLEKGFPLRAEQFIGVLQQFYKTEPLAKHHFKAFSVEKDLA